MRDLTIADFEPWLDRECEVVADGQRVTMTLVTAEPLKSSPRPGGGFRLEFLGPRDPLFNQSIMEVAGPNESHEIFMVPIAQDDGGTRYEAVFN